MPSNNNKSNKNRELWVFIEQKDGAPIRVSLELLGKGCILADKLGADVAAIFVGQKITNQAQELIYYGADKVIIADDRLAIDYRTEVYTDIIVTQALKRKPEILLFGATCIGRDLAPRVAGRLSTGCTADCTQLDIDQGKGLIVAGKPFLGRNVMADIICPHHRPQVVTVRPGVMELPAQDKTRRGELIYADVDFKEEDIKVKILDSIKSDTVGVNLENAEKIIAGGMGLGDAAGFELLKELADLLGAEMGATSPPVDAGWISHERQIGQTGKVIRPRLYIACGISGAIQHYVGMINSELIVAINKNPKAEIFDFADYGIVDDLYEIVPEIIDELKKLKRAPPH